MEMIQLEAFERAAREGSFTRAAEALNLTQPAVSLRITTLEAELGGTLFERRGRQLALTPLGERLLPYAQRMLALMADSLQAARDLQMGKTGEIKFAAPTPFLLSFLVDTLANFRYQHPNVDVRIRERDKITIMEMIRDKEISLGLVNAPIYDREFSVLAHFRDPIRPVVAATHPLAKSPKIPMQDIYHHTIFRVSLFPEMTAFIDNVVENARRASGSAVIAVPMVMALRLVTLGQGVTFLPQSYVQIAVNNGELVLLHIEDMPALYSEPLLIAHRSRELDFPHTEFARIFRATWRTLLAD